MELVDERSGEVFPLRQPFQPSLATVKIGGAWESLRIVDANYSNLRLTARLASTNVVGKFSAEVDESGIAFCFEGNSTSGNLIENFAWNLGIDPRGLSFLFPSWAGAKLDDDMPLGKELDFCYPMSLDAQFFLIEGRKSVLRFGSCEQKSPFCCISVKRIQQDLLAIRFAVEPTAPYTSTFRSPTYRIRTFPRWQEATRDYKAWMEGQFRPKKLTGRPRWLRNLKLVVMCMCGRSVYEPGTELHNYDDVITLVDLLRAYEAPKTTLIYLTGALVRMYDGSLPEYWPQPTQGGEEKFRQMLEHAHNNGFKIMCETNPFSVSYVNPLYETLKEHQVRNANGVRQGYRDYAGRQSENLLAYIRPSCKEWREYMANTHRRLVEKFPIDMILLDQHFLYFNDPGCDFDQIIPKYYEELAEVCTPTLLAGESCNERSVGADVPLSVVNSMLYSGSGARPSWVKIHPIDMELFRDYVVFCGHEGTLPSPEHRHVSGWPSEAREAKLGWSFEDQQERHKSLQLVPTVRITPRYGGLDEKTWAIIKEARDFEY